MFEPIYVLFNPSTEGFDQGYRHVTDEHPEVLFLRETDFPEQLRNLLRDQAEFVTFFCDDDVVVRPIPNEPESALDDQGVACLSLRLGRNTTTCYPMRQKQKVPSELIWEWRQAEGDFGYPMSLDGHVFRTAQLRPLVDRSAFVNPNQLESQLAVLATSTDWLPPMMECYPTSVICGVPVNRVNDTHPNRFGEVVSLNTTELNTRFLAGHRLSIPNVVPDGAHMEINLRFMKGEQ